MTPDALARLHSASFTQPPPWSAQSFAQLLAEPSCFVLTHMQGLDPVALALFRVAADEAELLTLATAPHARRNGFARALLTEGMHLARARGACTCFLEVAAPNFAARRLYEYAGFRPVGTRKAYYRAQGQTAVDAIVYKAELVD